EEPPDAGECGDDLLDHAVREIFLLGVAAHVLKRQDRDRRLVRERQNGRGRSRHGFGRARGAMNPVDPQRPSNVLDLLLAYILKGNIKLVAHLVAHDPADANPTGLSQSLESCREVDAVAVNVIGLDDDVADIDPDAKFYAAVDQRTLIAARHSALHLDR